MSGRYHMPQRGTNYFHLHLVSDATGETLITVARAAAAQYTAVSPVEHMHPLVRSRKQLDRVLTEIETAPGIVLYTLLEPELTERLEKTCRDLGLPCLSILGPVLGLFQAYLGGETKPRVGAQHVLNAEYFKRIDALELHHAARRRPARRRHGAGRRGAGRRVAHLEDADLDLSRQPRRQDRELSAGSRHAGAAETRNAGAAAGGGLDREPGADRADPPEPAARACAPSTTPIDYVDRQAVAAEIAAARKLCGKHNWPIIDVTRRSIEETAAEVMALLADRRRQPAS